MPPVPGRLFVGEQIDPATHQRNGTAVALDPAAFTTHGVIVGMTGSGKTGLGVVLLEEVLLSGVPVLIIDPKGDLGNLLLTFPTLAPTDFQPWIEPAPGAAPDPAAGAAQAAAWTEGLASWGIGPERIAELRAKAAFTIYTPGSTAGVPLNLVGGLGVVSSPGVVADPESVAEQVEATVSGLLGLVGIESDPLSGREHILLSNIVLASHANGTPLDLAALIGQIQTPPFRKLGVLDLDAFFPAADRMALALKLNGLLASPSFASWNQGEPIDIASMLTAPDGRPRAAIVSIAHLSDEERQFVVSLLLSRLIGWMRQQSGTTSLRALVYFDEVYGYAPPNGMPPAKKPILTLLKQARAFGVGMVLATQNPVDLDYKAIANAGTWMVGRLQTEQDKARLADGMTSAAGGDPKLISDQIAGLAKREFVLHQASSNEHPVFTSRWSMSFLRGPLTREQISSLTPPKLEPSPAPAAVLGTPAAPVVAAEPAAAAPVATDEILVAPTLAADLRSAHLSAGATWGPMVGAVAGGLRLEPALVVSASMHYDDTPLGVDYDEKFEALLFPLAEPFDPANLRVVDHDPRDFTTEAPAGARFVLPSVPLEKKAWIAGAQADVVAELLRSRRIAVHRHKALKLVAHPGEPPEQFAQRCAAAADAAADAEAAKIREALLAKADKLRDAIAKAEDRVEGLEDAKKAANTNEAVGIAGAVLGNLIGGRRTVRGMAGDVRGAASRRGQSTRAGGRIDEAENRLAEKTDDLAALEQDLAETLVEIDDKWAAIAAQVEVAEVGLEKSDVRIDDVFLVWIPTA